MDQHLFEQHFSFPKSNKVTQIFSSLPMDEIIPNVWISDLACALSPEHLTTANITHIITATSSRLAIPALASNREIDQLHVRIDDDDLAPIIVHFERSNKYIANAIRQGPGSDENGNQRITNNVLVHCHAGISRSVTVSTRKVHRRTNWLEMAF